MPLWATIFQMIISALAAIAPVLTQMQAANNQTAPKASDVAKGITTNALDAHGVTDTCQVAAVHAMVQNITPHIMNTLGNPLPPKK